MRALKKQYYKGAVASQLLLLPERIETDLNECEALKSAVTKLKEAGL